MLYCSNNLLFRLVGFRLQHVLLPYFSDIDECENPSLFSCPDLTRCVNLPGIYSCACVPGYESTIKGNITGLKIKCKGEKYVIHCLGLFLRGNKLTPRQKPMTSSVLIYLKEKIMRFPCRNGPKRYTLYY